MKISTYTITSIVVRPIRLAAIIMMMSVSTLKTAVTLYVKIYLDNNNNPSKSQQKLIKTYINNLYISEDTRTDQYRKSNIKINTNNNQSDQKREKFTLKEHNTVIPETGRVQ